MKKGLNIENNFKLKSDRCLLRPLGINCVKINLRKSAELTDQKQIILTVNASCSTYWSIHYFKALIEVEMS